MLLRKYSCDFLLLLTHSGWMYHTVWLIKLHAVCSSPTFIIFPLRIWKITKICKSVNQMGKIPNLLVFLFYHIRIIHYYSGKKKKPFLNLEEGDMGENGYMYTYGWIALLFACNYHNIALIGYTTGKNKKL